MTENGVRVPLVKWDFLTPRTFYDNKDAALAAYEGYIHFAELLEAGQNRAANMIVAALGRIPRDDELNLDKYASWSTNARVARDGAMLALAAAGTAETYRGLAAAKPPVEPAPEPAPATQENTAPAPSNRTQQSGPAPRTAPPQPTTWRQHEAAVTSRLRTINPGTTVGEQVTLDVTNTTTGEVVRIRIDNIYRNQSGQYQLVDAKFSSVQDLTTANLDSTVTANQSTAYGWIRNGQPVRVVPAGANATAAGLTPGTPIQIAPSVQVHVNSPAGVVVRTY